MSDVSIPIIDYCETDINTWKTLYSSLKDTWKDVACKEFNEALNKMVDLGLLSPNSPPILQEVSDYLMSETGWRIKPAAGLLSQREFFNSMAFRVFNSTQYVRHESEPFFCPEPDMLHEVLGHCPMLANQEFADMCQ